MSEQKIGSMLCPNCGKLIGINTDECIHCGFKNVGMWGWSSRLRRLWEQYDFAQIITTVCVALYVISILLDPRALLQPRGFLSFLSPSGTSLYLLGATGSFAFAEGRWWTLITAIYLHGGLLHIFFNLLWVRQLAPEVEDLFGTSRLILIFTFSGVIGFVLSNFMGIGLTIGASGSIFGLLGAIVAYGRMRGGTFGSEIYRQTLQSAIVLFLFGLFMPGVNNWAHGGGFIGGFLTAMLVGHSEASTERPWLQAATMATLAVTVLAFGMVIWQYIF